MNRQLRLIYRPATALMLTLLLALSAMAGAPPARAQTSDEQSSVRSLTNAEFRWGLTRQSSGPSHGPGLNFLSAGDSSSALASSGATITEPMWKATSGDVTIEKRTSGGTAATATWVGTQTDQAGKSLRDAASSKYSGLEMVLDNGRGTVDAEVGTAQITWDGTVSVLFYSGLVFLSISDPVLEVTRTSARVTATVGGRQSSMDNPEVSVPIPSREVVIANLPRSGVELGGEKGFSVTPEYAGVRYTAKAGETPQSTNSGNWGSFPREFVDFAAGAGSGPFWYSTGTSDDSKPALPIAVSWDSSAQEEMPDSDESGNSKGIIGQVLDDTMESILRAAGDDAADTAAAWMDEAWKPLQPDAATAAREGAAAGTPAGADVSAEVVSETTTDHMEEYFETVQVTAGTVGAAVASAPASSGSGSSGGASGGAGSTAPSGPASSVDQSTIPIAANSPLYGSDVVYAQTSASQRAGDPTHQWQWWVGAALLALAAMLFYQTVRRKD